MEGVELQDAFWMHCLKCFTASQISFGVLRMTFMFSWSLTVCWNILQFVLELSKLHGGRTCYPNMSNVRITGEWSDESSQQDLHVAVDVDMPFVMKKSLRSGVLLIYVGQKVGLPVEITTRCFLWHKAIIVLLEKQCFSSNGCA